MPEKTKTTQRAPAPAPFKRSYTDTSWWNLKKFGWPVDPHSAQYIANLKSTESNDFVLFAVGSWAMGFSEGNSSMPLVTISDVQGDHVTLHVDPKLPLMTGNDAAAVMRCWDCGIEVSVFEYDPATHHCKNFGLYALNSDGLPGTTGVVPGVVNDGHRGIPPFEQLVTLAELNSGAIKHSLKIAVTSPADFRLDGGQMPIFPPMDGFEQGHGNAIPEGALLLLKPSAFDRVAPKLTAAGKVLATALRDYGLVVGDTGGHASLKGQLNVTFPTGTAAGVTSFSFSDYQVALLGHTRSV